MRYCAKEPWQLSKKDVTEYLNYLAEHHSGSTLNVALNAIRFVIQEIMHKNWKLGLKYSKKAKALPTVLTKEEVLRLISAIENPKHRFMISLMYSAGLRVSELINLKSSDFEFESNIGWVRHGKGNKDRMFMIAERLKDELRELVASTDSYIFTGNKHTNTSKETVFRIVKRAAKKAGITKNVHPHTLRHTFATHLIQNGYDVSAVQLLLGHSNTQTTMMYVHMASPKMISVKSPLDSLS